MIPRNGQAGWAREAGLLLAFAVIVLTMPQWLVWIGGYSALATKIMIWALFALGFDILLGFTGYLSFGHAAFFGTAAYATGLSFRDFSPEIGPALLFSLAATIPLALVLGYLTLRRTGIYFSILTLAFAQMLHAAALSIFSDWTGGDNGLTMDVSPAFMGEDLSDRAIFYIAAGTLVVGYAIARQIRRSPFGLMLMAIKENPMRLEYTGAHLRIYKIAAFVISALYGSVAGFLMVVYEPYVATKYLHWSTSGELVIMSVIGGVNTLIGPMIGATFMLYFENVVQGYLGEQWKLVLGIIFVLVVIFVPGGFVDMYNRARRQLGLIARRRRPNVPDAPGSIEEEHARPLDVQARHELPTE